VLLKNKLSYSQPKAKIKPVDKVRPTLLSGQAGRNGSKKEAFRRPFYLHAKAATMPNRGERAAIPAGPG
jgi:hypothetical protein